MTIKATAHDREWAALAALAEVKTDELDDALSLDRRILKRLEAQGLVHEVDGRRELTPSARLRLASHHLLHGDAT
jgi:ribosomal protein S19E (S16A)